MEPGTEVVVELRGEEVVVRKLKLPGSYVDYYVQTYAQKLRSEVDLKKIIEEEVAERHGSISTLTSSYIQSSTTKKLCPKPEELRKFFKGLREEI